MGIPAHTRILLIPDDEGTTREYGISRPMIVTLIALTGITLVVLGLWIVVVIKLVIPLFTFRGRRMLVGRFRRIRAWEFWPLWLFCAPVVLRTS